MNKLPFSTQVRDARLRLGLTLRQLAEAVGTPHQIISKISSTTITRGGRCERIVRRLGIETQRTECSAPIPVTREIDRYRERRPLRWRGERNSSRNIGAAFIAYPELMHHLACCVPDWTPAFLRRTIFFSGLEVAAVYQWLAHAPKPALVSLLRLGFRLHPIVHPDSEKHNRAVIHDQKFPALIVGDMLLVFQVPVLASNSVYILDVLAKHEGCWVDLEIDGPAHQPRRDQDRTRDLLLPIVRVDESEVNAHDFVARARAKVRARLGRP